MKRVLLGAALVFSLMFAIGAIAAPKTVCWCPEGDLVQEFGPGDKLKLTCTVGQVRCSIDLV